MWDKYAFKILNNWAAETVPSLPITAGMKTETSDGGLLVYYQRNSALICLNTLQVTCLDSVF